jgi:hypothetical protein
MRVSRLSQSHSNQACLTERFISYTRRASCTTDDGMAGQPVSLQRHRLRASPAALSRTFRPLRWGVLHGCASRIFAASMAFTLDIRARHSPHRITARQASLDVTDRSVAHPINGMLDAGLRHHPFPDDTASLLPGPLTATRTRLPPASDDELTNQRSTNHQLSRDAHIAGDIAFGEVLVVLPPPRQRQGSCDTSVGIDVVTAPPRNPWIRGNFLGAARV